MKHEEFAERAGRRLEDESKRLGMDGEAAKTTARAQELRVAALLVREEAAAVGHKEHEPPREKVAEYLSLEAQG
jgi:hypothetical protein